MRTPKKNKPQTTQNQTRAGQIPGTAGDALSLHQLQPQRPWNNTEARTGGTTEWVLYPHTLSHRAAPNPRHFCSTGQSYGPAQVSFHPTPTQLTPGIGADSMFKQPLCVTASLCSSCLFLRAAAARIKRPRHHTTQLQRRNWKLFCACIRASLKKLLG